VQQLAEPGPKYKNMKAQGAALLIVMAPGRSPEINNVGCYNQVSKPLILKMMRRIKLEEAFMNTKTDFLHLYV
jgi:hypothetical protein